MKKMICLLPALLIMACGTKTTSVKKYYFPYTKLTTPQVYLFTNPADTSQHMYWYLKTEIQNADTILGIHVFNNECVLTNILFNRIDNEGVRLKKVILVSPQNHSAIQYTVTRDEVMDWKVKPADRLYVSFGAKDSSGTTGQDVIIEKSISDKKPEIGFSGKMYPCILVNELTTINITSVNRTKTEEQQRTGYYAEGLGLVRFETSLSDGSVTTMALDKILDEKEWETLREAKKDTSALKPVIN